MLPLVLRALWIALLLAPNVSTLAFANAWDAAPPVIAVVSAGAVALLYALLPRKLLLVVTYPVIILGIAVLAADWHARVNLLELVAVAYSFRPGEMFNALRPYLPALALVMTAVLLLMIALWRTDTRGPLRPRTRLVAGIAAVACFALAPARIRFAAWPLNLVESIASSQSLDVGIALSQVPTTRTSPRDRFRHWNASRRIATQKRETYVLVIGETIRSDRFPECGGRREITALARGTLTYCDVLAGAGNTHMSVPLLLSREMPGHVERVSRDSTFIRAFEDVGFETFWLSVQPKSIAWPDAQNQWFQLDEGLDRDLLLPKLKEAMARPVQRKLIVLHAYNAHSPYVSRYRKTDAPFAVVESRAEVDRVQRWNAYDNAIDESAKFLNAVIDSVSAESGEAFVLYTPDHAENMDDDARRLRDHALKFPTYWDTRVPAVMWANDEWRQANSKMWDSLLLNRDKPLMHMDMAPTMLGAARIVYDEPRTLPVDLTSRVSPVRRRITQVRAGQTIDAETLRREAGMTGANAPTP